MPRKRRSRVYLHGTRYWGDFRDLGGAGESLIPNGENYATADLDVATKPASDRVTELEQRRRNRAILGVDRTAKPKEFCGYHLERKAESSEVTDCWLEETEKRFERAVDFFGADRDLHTIAPRDVQDWATHLARTRYRGKT